MKNFVQQGNVLTMTALAGGAVAGLIHQHGSVFGVAATSAVEGDDYELAIGEVFELPKVSAQAWTRGQDVFWDATAKLATTVAGGNLLIGAATEVAANPTSVGRVRLNASFGQDSGIASSAVGVAAAGGANVAEVTVTVKDAGGATVAKPSVLDLWLSDDADGEGLTAVTASGTVQPKAASGTLFSALVAKKALRVQTLKTGAFVLEITDTAKTPFKVCASIGGRTVVLLTLLTANYG